MKKITFLLIALIAGAFAMQVNAQPAKAPMRSAVFSQLPSGFEQVGETSLYYNIAERYAVGPGYKYGYCILGKIGNYYYSSTYESGNESGPGAGFIAAFKVGNGTAQYLNAKTGTSYDNVDMTARIEPQGDVAARIVYSLKNNNSTAVTVSAGIWGDIMIGDNDKAPLSRLLNTNNEAYGIRMKYEDSETSPLLCMLFGEGITGVTAADDYWFGSFYSNYTANAICGNYSENISNDGVENGNYDCGLGFCWKNRTIEAGETIELSYVVSVGEIDFEEPIVPGQDLFTYEVWAENIGDDWNNFDAEHPAHIKGYYEHPYGQAAYIEYRVDGGEWIRIEEALESGAEYERVFPMYFNEAINDIHTLDLRFTLGEDLGYTDLDGLEWEDVRSFSLTVDPAEQVYNGQPQTFVVTVGGVIDYPVEYTDAGDYSYSIYGLYEMNTIGVNTVDFAITKAQQIINVVVPDDVEYDGQAHGATVTLVQGDGDVIVTYVNTATGAESTTAPTEVGNYAVFVEVTGTNNYEGIPNTAYGDFSIYSDPTGVNEITVDSEDNGAWYTIDGRRIATPTQRGIYIHNGKKYVVK